jgi:hypothetical protein
VSGEASVGGDGIYSVDVEATVGKRTSLEGSHCVGCLLYVCVELCVGGRMEREKRASGLGTVWA